jgi:hypothetical protein
MTPYGALTVIKMRFLGCYVKPPARQPSASQRSAVNSRDLMTME